MQPSSFKRHPLAIALSSLLSSAVLAPTVHAYELVWDAAATATVGFMPTIISSTPIPTGPTTTWCPLQATAWFLTATPD